MIKELSWYLETGRFSGLVAELDSLAEEYASALASASPDRLSARQKLVDLISWNIERSGLDVGASPDDFVDGTLFQNDDLNRDALDGLEKDLIKAHMYQKHLWDYMGTMSMYSPISKRALERDGYEYEDYLPVSYRNEHKDKSPISNILSEDRKSVPIYAYYDGTISSAYDSKKARIHFDSLQDTSGFDWVRKGWDPNYEVTKEWQGTFNKAGEWVETREAAPKSNRVLALSDVATLSIQVIKDGDTAILYDPYYEFMYAYLACKYSETDEDADDVNEDRIARTVASVRSALSSLGVKKISSVVRNPYANRMSDDDRSDIPHFADIIEDDEKVSSIYKRIFGDVLADNIGFKDISQARTIQKEQEDDYKNGIRRKNGRELALRFDFAASKGFKGEEIVDAVFTGSARMPLNHKLAVDLQYAGLDQSEVSQVMNYEIPESKSTLFSRTLFNALANFEVLKNAEYTKSELIDDVYNKVVAGKKITKEIDIETSFDELFDKGLKSLVTEKITDEEKAEFDESREEILSQAHTSYRDKLAVALDNAIGGYPLVKRNVPDMSPHDLLVRARDDFRKRHRVVADVGITYRSSAKYEQQEERVRLFETVDMDDFLARSAEEEEHRRLRDYSTEFNEYVQDVKSVPDLFSPGDNEAFFKSDLFKRSQLDIDKVREITDNERSSVDAALEQDSGVVSNTIKSIPIPTMDLDIGRLVSSDEIESRNEDAAYLTDVLGSDLVRAELFAEGAMFYAYITNGSQLQVESGALDGAEEESYGGDEGLEIEEEASGSAKADAMDQAVNDSGRKAQKPDDNTNDDNKKHVEIDNSNREAGRRESALDEEDDGSADAALKAGDNKKHVEIDNSNREAERRESALDEEDDGSADVALKAGDDRADIVAEAGRKPLPELPDGAGEAGRKPLPELPDGAGDERSSVDLPDAVAQSDEQYAHEAKSESDHEPQAVISDSKRKDRKSKSEDDAQGDVSRKKRIPVEQDVPADSGEAEAYDDSSLSEGYDSVSGRMKLYDRGAFTEDGEVFVDRKGDAFVIVNDLVKDYKYKVPAEVEADASVSKAKSKRKASGYMDRVRGRSKQTGVSANAPADEAVAKKIDAMLKEWAISEGFVYYNVNTKETVYDKNLAVYGFNKKFSSSDYYTYFYKKIAPQAPAEDEGADLAFHDEADGLQGESQPLQAHEDHREAQEQEYKPTFTGYPDFNKQNRERAEAVIKRKKPAATPEEQAKEAAAEAEKERIRRSTERYLEDRKKLADFVDSCIKDVNESKINAQAERAEKVLISSIVSSLESRMKK